MAAAKAVADDVAEALGKGVNAVRTKAGDAVAL